MTILKISGLLVSLVSFYLVFKPRYFVKLDWRVALIPFSLFLVTGINDTLLKLTEHFFIRDDIHLFLTVVYGVALILGTIQLVFLMKHGKNHFAWRNVPGGLFLGTLNFWTTWLFIRSMMEFPASFIFPVFNVSVVSITALAGLLLFKEKMRVASWIGILLAIFAILMISTS